MKQAKTILVTGSSGYVGSALVELLKRRGHTVFGPSRSGEGPGVLRCDLTDRESLKEALRKAPAFTSVIHTASIKPGRGTREYESSVLMTRNLVESLPRNSTHFIHLSSVDVYGLKAMEKMRRGEEVWPEEEMVPTDEYGISKMESELLVKWAGFKEYQILRVAPVYDGTHTDNLRKRIMVPGLNLKLEMKPAPLYSFCHLETLLDALLSLVKTPLTERRVYHICDRDLQSRDEVSRLFPGSRFAVPSALLSAGFLLLRGIPGAPGRRMRLLYYKVFSSTDYRNGAYRAGKRGVR